MNLAREEAIRNFREHWASLAITGVDEKHKGDYLTQNGYKNIRYNCFLCEFARGGFAPDCTKCPIEWPKIYKNGSICPCIQSYYLEWRWANNPEERKRLAAIIRDLPGKPLEKKIKVPESPPKYKPGDKVVPVDKTTLNLYGDPYVSNIKGDIHWEKSKKRGYFFAGPVDERASKVNGCIVYECGYTEDGIGIIVNPTCALALSRKSLLITPRRTKQRKVSFSHSRDTFPFKQSLFFMDLQLFVFFTTTIYRLRALRNVHPTILLTKHLEM